MAVSLPAMAATTIMDNVNVRSGPGTQYGRIGSYIDQGSTFTIMFSCTGSQLNNSRTWYYVENINCNCGASNCPAEGYIHSSCVSGSPITSRPGNANQAFGYNTLRIGSMGPEVYNVQLVLVACGGFSGFDGLEDCDGLYGNATAAAVRAFQERYYLNSADGLVGPETRTALWNHRTNAMTGVDFLNYYGVKCY